ncbi:MAG TPA: S-layer homology domain-containing protein [Chloroflexia bacterium]|jgi:hypothetical protein
MKRITFVFATLTLLLIGLAVSLHSPKPADAQGTYQTFTETGKTVQYVERAVFEGHPEYLGAHFVLLSQSGNFRYQTKYPGGGPAQPAPTQPPASGAPIATPCSIQFSDVPAGPTPHVFYPYIRCLACRGLMGGYSDGTFRPDYNITRGQLSKIVSNAAGFNEPVSGQRFEDVPPSSTFYEYIERLAGRGIIGGYPCVSDSTSEPCGVPPKPYFRPNADATRGQISKVVSDAAGFNESPGAQIYEDVPADPRHKFYDWIWRLSSRRIMGGYKCKDSGTVDLCVPTYNRPYFHPDDNATRGQVSKIVANTFYPDCETPNRAKP